MKLNSNLIASFLICLLAGCGSQDNGSSVNNRLDEINKHIEKLETDIQDVDRQTNVRLTSRDRILQQLQNLLANINAKILQLQRQVKKLRENRSTRAAVPDVPNAIS